MTRITTTAHQNDSSADDDTTIEYQLGPGDFGRAQEVGESAIVNESGSGSNDESAAPEFGDRHTYFDQRKRKLAEQAQQRAENAPKYTPIFAGVVFHINGYTQPSHYELKKLLIERGGRFLHYLSKLQVTHIIASNLARSKEKELRNYRVVRPEWVVESVKADRLLSWHTYRLGDSASRGVPVALVGADELADLRKYGEGLNRDWVRRNLATEKDFIQRYYANSRLHHLSTWKAELKDYVARLRREHHKDTAAPAAGRQRIIMHADFDCFFVSASLLSYPQLKDRPVAVCHSQQQMQVDDEGRAARMSEYSANSSQIASCNYAARSFGVKNGMFIGQARQLCPTLATVPYCFDAYKRISTAFYDIITRISGETQAVSVDEALIDVSDVVEREFQGNATALAEEIRKRVLAQT
ncbi:deoxycytidyl transferase, partial [Coemansia sp. RSA 2705]